MCLCCVGVKFRPKVASLQISIFAEWAEFIEYDLRVFFCIFGKQYKFYIYVEMLTTFCFKKTYISENTAPPIEQSMWALTPLSDSQLGKSRVSDQATESEKENQNVFV